jgi:hypothetical protein
LKNPKPVPKRKRSQLKAAAKPYEPTVGERALRDRFLEKPSHRIVATKETGSAVHLKPDHPDPQIGPLLLMQALGTEDTAFYEGLLMQLANAGSAGREPDEKGINFMLSVIKGVAPRDQLETMLAAQMAAVHMATMTLARRLAQVESIQQQDSAERAFNKLARTFTTQIEALKRYRTGGEQNVTVKHVTVNSGGQAIVGNVSHDGPGEKAVALLTQSQEEGMPLLLGPGGGGAKQKARATS